MSSNKTTPQVCIIFPGSLGDFVCFLPTLNALKTDAGVDLFAREEFADIVPGGVNVCPLAGYEITRCFVAGSERQAELADFFSRYSAVYSWHGSQQPEFVHAIAALSRGRASVFPFRPSSTGQHQIDYYLSCVGIHNNCSIMPTISLRPEAIAWTNQYWQRHSLNTKPVLVLAPGSGAREKNWPQQYFQAVVRWWREETQGHVVVLIGPVEEERGGIEGLLDCDLVVRDFDLARVAALLSRSDCFLGNDSGVTHLAAAVGAQTIALFGPSDVRQWAPRGRHVTILTHDVECSPCEIDEMKSCLHRKCLKDLRPAEVIGVLKGFAKFANLTRGEAGIKV